MTHTGGVYASYSEWTEKEVETARKKFSTEKPVVEIRQKRENLDSRRE